MKKSGLTFAPETASPRLRALVNKSISEEKILASVRTAVQAGWQGISYPSWSGCRLRLRPKPRKSGGSWMKSRAPAGARRSDSTCRRSCPSRTPLQWAGFESVASLNEKIHGIKAGAEAAQCEGEVESPEVSCLQAALARGDEKLGQVVECVYRKGGVFQEWTEKFSYSLWQQGFVENALDLDSYLAAKPRGRRCPGTSWMPA